MKQKNCGTKILLGTILIMVGLSVGCRLVFFTGAVAVGTAGAVGYSVYQGGESVVTGVGNLASSDSEDKSANVETVVVTGKIFKTECAGSVEQVWLAASRAFQRANFQHVTGKYDLLSGMITAQTWGNTPVTLTLQNANPNHTILRIWIGAQNDLKAAQSIYNLVQEELNKAIPTAPSAAPKETTP